MKDLEGRRFGELLEAAPDALVCVAADGRIAVVNARAEQLFGYDRGELAGQPVEILVPGAARAQHRVHRARYVADPRPRPMGGGMELVGRRSDGTTFPAEISLLAIETDRGVLITATVRDVTDRLATGRSGNGREPRPAGRATAITDADAAKRVPGEDRPAG